MRLAGYLRPEPSLERKHVQAVVVEKKEEKSGWGRFGFGGSSRKKSVAEPLPSSLSPVPTPTPGLMSPTIGGAENDSVKMTVRAEEVTFRKENDFGVWESRSGFGIVIVVKVARTS